MAEHLDVLVVGAGLSGIGAACHLQRDLPGATFAVLEARDTTGGTWDLFRYPGVRSDSDMHTLGYAFRPWTGATAIADGQSILDYVRATAREHGVDRRIRFGAWVERAEWSSVTARWTVQVRDTGTGDLSELTCGFLLCCTGYYRYDEGYTPPLPGIERFGGTVVHPQHWPADLDWTDRRVLVVGSGATAVTLVPALAEHAAHVTMLQRSPTYVLSLPTRDPLAGLLRRFLPTRMALRLVRAKNIAGAQALFQLSRRAPRLVKALLRKGAAARLPAGYDVDRHFGPTYDPWDQRLCFVPDGDLFAAVSSGRASVVTDTIDEFTETGVRLRSGADVPADLVVTATGLNLLALGGMTLSVDGEEVDLAETVAYKGMMLSGVPNLALALGYTNASWTLKVDLVLDYVVRLLRHLNETGYDACTPVRPPGTADGAGLRPIIDLRSGYVLRSLDRLPKQGPRTPWRLHQNYPRDLWMLRHGPLDDGVRFTRAGRLAPDRA